MVVVEYFRLSRTPCSRTMERGLRAPPRRLGSVKHEAKPVCAKSPVAGGLLDWRDQRDNLAVGVRV